MNSFAMTIINPKKRYWPSRESNKLPPVLKSATLPTELWGSTQNMWTNVLKLFQNYRTKKRHGQPSLPNLWTVSWITSHSIHTWEINNLWLVKPCGRLNQSEYGLANQKLCYSQKPLNISRYILLFVTRLNLYLYQTTRGFNEHWKTLLEEEKMLVTSIFSFFPTMFSSLIGSNPII